MTPATEQALRNVRDPSLLQWYVVPLLALIVYIYAVEVEKRNWRAVFCGLAFWGMDWINEIANSVVLHATGYAPLWITPGNTAYLLFVGVNVEIIFMFSIAGVALAKLLHPDPKHRILGIPNRWFVACVNSAFCVFVEVLLWRSGIFVWEWAYWGVPHLWSVFLLGYLHFHVVAFWVHDMRSVRAQATAVGVIWGIAAAGVGVFGFGLGWL